MVGKTIAHYQILEKIGEGGMGVVYRARDTKLGRDVAVKILPEQFARDPQRMARFSREAHLLAALSHAHIASIYGLEEQDGVHALVVELVEGETLAERIKQGPIPLEEALTIAGQVADALEASHGKGIIHRDLKPGNIKIKPDGTVKVLDFGLAIMAEATLAPDGDPGKSPTITLEDATRAGTILGTAAYMSPEQARGKRVDKRADIWAFGVVLYEMLTGRRLFEGETISDTLASVLKEEPKLDEVPAKVQRLLRRCLEKDPAKRLRDIGDAWELLEDEPTKGAAALSRWRLWPAVAGVFLAIATGISIVHFREKPAELPVVRFTIGPPEKADFFRSGGVIYPFAVSPDGRRVVFTAGAPGARTQLWVRSLDTFAARPLAGTENGIVPFWSPDSRSIGFAASGKLKKIDANGGPALTLADAPMFRGGTWNRDGTILFAPNARDSPLLRVPASGGTASAATKLDQSRREVAHRFPWFLPDERHFLFASAVTSGDQVTIRAGSLNSQESKVLVEANSNAVYARGHLLYIRESTLMAQPFDPKRVATTGDAVPIAEEVQSLFSAGNSFGHFSVSQNGLLAYADRQPSTMSLTWFDRGGKRLSTVGDPDLLGRIHLSPDRKGAAVAVTAGSNTDIWIYDMLRGLRSRFTFDPASEGEAIWSPDGREIVFNSNRKGTYDLYRKSADGIGAEELLYSDELSKWPKRWSPDGKFLLYSTTSPRGEYDLWVLPMAGDGRAPSKAYPWLQTGFSENQAQFSPDGRWVAYESNESVRNEIYVTPFPGPGGKRQVSTAGGTYARWSPNGKEIYYIGPDQKLMAVEVSAKGTTIEIGESRPLFGPLALGGGFQYDVSADGQRFLAVVPAEGRGNLTDDTIKLVLNWMAGLKK